MEKANKLSNERVFVSRAFETDRRGKKKDAPFISSQAVGHSQYSLFF